jgi:glycosyltransferase involved in cell wall biosynthesis
MWPFTGGCHYAGECTHFENACGSCPALQSTEEDDVSRRIWRRKQAVYGDTQLVPVAPSRWMAECAKRSTLFSTKDVRHIPNGLNTSRYARESVEEARDLFEISSDESVVLFGAMSAVSDDRKGYQFLREALESLASKGRGDDLRLVVFGSEEEDQGGYGFDTRFTGYVPDEHLPALYRAADTVVVPSVQDNLPNVVLESMAAGTPCVGFDIGGIPDMITHQVDGYLASPSDPLELAEGIRWTLADDKRLDRLSRAAREKVKREFTIEGACEEYEALYEELTATSKER